MLKPVIVFTFILAALAGPVVQDELDDHWELFKAKHRKEYGSKQEETLRRVIWEGHVDYIARHNREYDMGIHTYTLGLNEYADMRHEEFIAQMNGYHGKRTSNSTHVFMIPENIKVPDSVDWRKEGYVTPVKNQKECGACWAFSTTGSLEGQHFKSTGQLVSLSEQNLVDCSKPEGNNGCHGGLMDNGFQYIKKNGGIDTEASYPYEAKDGNCRYKPEHSGATDTGYVDVKSKDENALKAACATVGPIAVAIDARDLEFQLYKDGVYNPYICSSRIVDLNHGVLVVGYGSTGSQDYWIVKNSWGTTWGQQGYIWMIRNKNNHCGIATEASYPLV